MWRLLCLASPLVAAVALYRPALDLLLMGDDYQWAQHAHWATHNLRLLLADLDTFLRPANTWLLILDRWLWGWEPAGFHLTSVLVHGGCGVLLALAAHRLGLPSVAAAGVGLLWACSPFTSEPAIQVAIRFENLLLCSWLLLALWWPGREGRWSHGRLLLVGGAVLLAAASKETWVVIPGLVWLLELGWRGRTALGSLRSAGAVALLAGAYTGAYFLAFPSDKDYYEFSLAVLAKLPHQWAAFLHLEPLMPAEFPFSWQGILALAAVLGAGYAAWRLRNPVGLTGLGLLVLPSLPTLLVPYLPTRHTAIPYAGFLVLAFGLGAHVVGRLPAGRRRLALAGAAGLAGLVFAAGVFTVQAELEDAARVSQAHRRLLQRCPQVAPDFPLGTPVLFVRLEQENPLLEIARSVRGWPKLYYVRHPDPWGLIEFPALVEWCRAEEGFTVRRLSGPAAVLPRDPAFIVAHTPGGFSWVPPGSIQAARLAHTLEAGGVYWRMVQADRKEVP